MKRLCIISLATLAVVQVSAGAAPGPIDGKNIPGTFANSAIVGLQTNRTGFGNVTTLAPTPSFSDGSELDALYLAADFNFLYVGLAGNLLDLGNSFVILIDNPFDAGQTELRTEGVGGPPHVLSMAGRLITVNTNGTASPTDDTYTATPNSGMRLPTCGAPSFTGWDYALAVGTTSGVAAGHEYLLYSSSIGNASASSQCDFGDGRGNVPCDPTPGNPNDPPLPIYAVVHYVLQTPIGDGDEEFEGGEPQYGYSRGGFNNTNITGVTSSSATLAAVTTTGLEVAIPLANIGSGVFPEDTVRIMVLVMDGDVGGVSGVSEGLGVVLNQALPSLGAGSGVCNPPDSLGLRPNLSSIASCLSVQLDTLPPIAGGAVLDGVIKKANYGVSSPTLTQSCPTSGGDRIQLADSLTPVQSGSELDALYADNDDDFMYLGITGNLEGNGNSINVFIDMDGQVDGEHTVDFPSNSEVYTSTTLTTFNNFQLTGWYERWVTATFTSGSDSFRVQSTDFGGGYYDINPNVNAAGATGLHVEFTVNPANVADTLRIILVDEDITERVYRIDGLTVGPHAVDIPLSAYSNDNSVGTIPGLDVSNLSFFHLTGGFNHDNPGVALDITFEHMSLTGVVAGAAAIVTLDGDELANGPLDTLQNGRFSSNEAVKYDVAYGINIGYAPRLAYVDFFDFVNDAFTFRGAVEPDYGDATLFDNPGGLVAENPNGLQMAFNNWNTNGVVSCADGEACFLEDANTVGLLAKQATKGVELAIPLADLGLDGGDLPRLVNVWTLLAGRNGNASDQSLPSMRNFSAAGNQVTLAGNPPVNFTNPFGGAGQRFLLTSFGNFALTGTYSQWTTATFTSGTDDFRVQSRDFGGGWYDMEPNINAAGATKLELEVTLNPANATDKIVVVLVDADGTERVYRFENLTNGHYVLSVPLARYINDNAQGTVPGLDVTNLSMFHLGGAFHHGNPGFVMDVTFQELALVGEPRNFEARAARICLGTIDGDADCDGDNDLVDYALFQQCVGLGAKAVLPMECERLNFVKNGKVDAADYPAFNAVLTGP
jgi:hypothetical protein